MAKPAAPESPHVTVRRRGTPARSGSRGRRQSRRGGGLADVFEDGTANAAVGPSSGGGRARLRLSPGGGTKSGDSGSARNSGRSPSSRTAPGKGRRESPAAGRGAVTGPLVPNGGSAAASPFGTARFRGDGRENNRNDGTPRESRKGHGKRPRRPSPGGLREKRPRRAGGSRTAREGVDGLGSEKPEPAVVGKPTVAGKPPPLDVQLEAEAQPAELAAEPTKPAAAAKRTRPARDGSDSDSAPVAARTRRSARLPDASLPEGAPVPRAGARLGVLFSARDGWGSTREEWFHGTVESVGPRGRRRGCGSSRFEGRLAFDDGTDASFEYPSDDVRLLPPEEEEPEARGRITAGSTVDGRFMDNDDGRWYRATVASVREDSRGTTLLDLVYHDGECESNVPLSAVRLIELRDSDDWLVGKPVLMQGEKRRGRVISVDGRGGAAVRFGRGRTTTAVEAEVACRAVFADRADAAAAHHVRPIAAPRRRRRQQSSAKSDCEKGRALAPSRASKRQKGTKTTAGKSAAKPVGLVPGPPVAVEPVRRQDYAPSLVELSEPSPPPRQNTVRAAARGFPATLPNLLMLALDGPEPETGLVHLLGLLRVHDALPPASTCRKLMELMKRGPRDRGREVRFADAHRTELAFDYARALVGSSRRLVRPDGSAPFGPSSWDDVDALLSQSITRTENLEPGAPTERMAGALHLAARGAGLLGLMLRTELRGREPCLRSDGGGAPPRPFGRDELRSMPTVRAILSHGARSALRAAASNAAGCLARHRAFLVAGATPQASPHGITCRVQAAACVDGLASTVGLVAYVFRAHEGLAPSDPGALFVIRDELSRVFEGSLEERGLRGEEREAARRELGRSFCAALCQERYAEPFVVPLAGMLGLGSADMPGFLFECYR